MNVQLMGTIRRFARMGLANAAQTLRLSGLESLSTNQVEPEGFELARAGRRFYGGGQNGATGRAPVQSIPTTAAAFLLWNGESAGGPAYAIEQIGVLLISGTAGIGGAIVAALTNTAIAAPTPATGYATASASKGGAASRSIWADNQTLGATPTWGVLAAHGHPAITPNGGIVIDVKGRIVVPPGYGFALHYLSGAGTSPLYVASAIWSEIECELE